MIPAIVILLTSLPIAWVSRRSLLRPSSHGFARFFAFEAILVLTVLNVPHWFDDPLSLQQTLSWVLLVGSIVVGASGIVMLHRHGGPRSPDPDPALYEWESTSRLVTGGIFRYVRHPMYASLLYLAWGATLKSIGVYTVALALVATVALLFTAMAEEKENVARFGDDYVRYMRRTRRFIPYLL